MGQYESLIAADQPSRHHLLFPRQEWELRPQAARIRQTTSMIPVMRRQDHDYMHQVVPIVPLLGYQALVNIPSLWRQTGRTLEDIDRLCLAIDHATASRAIKPLERDLGGLTIEALKMQQTVLKEVGFTNGR